MKVDLSEETATPDGGKLTQEPRFTMPVVVPLGNIKDLVAGGGVSQTDSITEDPNSQL